VAIIAVDYSFNLRGTSALMHIGVSIGVRGRRLPGPIVLRCVALDGIVLMAVRSQLVHFADTCCKTIFQFNQRMT
jgi:hypothetical protein